MSYQCEHDGGEPDPVDCAWCLFDLEARLDRLSRNLAIAGALCAAYLGGFYAGFDTHRRQARGHGSTSSR